MAWPREPWSFPAPRCCRWRARNSATSAASPMRADLLRAALDQCLDGRPLRTREVLIAMRAHGGGAGRLKHAHPSIAPRRQHRSRRHAAAGTSRDVPGSAACRARRRAVGRRQHNAAPARGSPAHPGPRRHPHARGTADAHEPGDGGHRRDAGDRAGRASAGLLPRSGETRRAHDRGRARRRRAARPPARLLRGAARIRHPRLAVRGPGAAAARGRARGRRAGGRTAHRSLCRLDRRAAGDRADADRRGRALRLADWA